MDTGRSGFNWTDNAEAISLLHNPGFCFQMGCEAVVFVDFERALPAWRLHRGPLLAAKFFSSEEK